MLKIGKANSKLETLKGFFKGQKPLVGLNQTNHKFTTYQATKTSYIYLGAKTDFTRNLLRTVVALIVQENQLGYNLDLASFVTKNVPLKSVIEIMTEEIMFASNLIYSAKTASKKAPKTFVLLGLTTPVTKDKFAEAKMISEIMIWVRSKQLMPPNQLNSESFAHEVATKFSKIKNVKCTILNKKQIEAQNMGLFLSVNRGSTFEPRLVVLEYFGDAKSKEVSALVGKGIMFDAGGYNIKTGAHMRGMKYDMSGAAVVIGAMEAIANFKPQANFVVVAPLTDNRLNGDASMPDMVFEAMNGKTVEVNNTDAEGRLVLADGITYAIRKLKATNITTIATLTGAVLVALGNTYTGAWASNSAVWKRLETAAIKNHELVWRMPFHADFLKYMQGSKVADLRNTDYTGKGGSNSAAMFLKEFTENKPFVHLDIAGTADVNENAMSPLVKTLAHLAK